MHARSSSAVSVSAAVKVFVSCAFAVLLAVSPCLHGEVHATCRCGTGDLELVFILDATGSMGPVIGTVKAQAERIIEILEGQVENLRVGTVGFRTRLDPEMSRPVFHDLTSDRKKLARWLRKLRAKAGGDEAVDDGLDVALHEMSWTKEARKVVVLIGDEGPSDEGTERLLALADEAKGAGITVHTITASATAWRYFFDVLRNTDPARAERILARYESMDKLKKSFRLPVFEETALRGGGRAVGTDDTREILKWLLAFALGASDEEEPPDIPPATAEEDREKGKEDPAEQARGRSRIGYVRYGGDWSTPRSFDGLVRGLHKLVRIDLDERVDVVTLADEDNWKRPLLYLSGHGPVDLSEAERRGLKAYAEAGGLVWIDNCCGKKLFDETMRKELAKAFGGAPLARLAPSHPVFEIGHVIATVRSTTAHRRLPYAERAPHVEAVELDGREVVLYTPHSLGAGWKTYPYGSPCMMHDDDALRLSENIVLYAFSR
jgi:hypothetical protein